MNRQELANRIWATANKMRSSIDAGEYKDYILGFVFYKYLSENELAFLRKNDWEDEDFRYDLNEDNQKDADFLKQNIGYFISYDGLFSTWVNPEFDFNEGHVIDALNAFARNVNPQYAHVFAGIFDTLSMKLPRLAETPAKRTSAITDILNLIDPIPMTGAEGYDVLGFIYEYLISNFAANAGKKAGEFYTPHEVAELMSDIVAHHLRDRSEISIYDPTSGSASLLLNIGQSVARHNGNSDGIRYYAQELNEATYNLSRMNLVMKGLKPSNIVARRADTLEEDWPRQKDSEQPLRVDACVSNPPYSQNWKTKGKENDPRFSPYGVAPKSKADYAFLLHNLYHLRPDGIMAIVLPHGVLFRGAAEEEIRRKLVDSGVIDTIIGLPPNIFFGTGIATIVMILKPVRENRDILFIDASKGFVKDGKKNRLRRRDIRRAFDAYVNRRDVEGYCHVADMAEIKRNGYNLNIPRYVDFGESVELWDIYSIMRGGIPSEEIDALRPYWDAMPGLREAIFEYKDGRFHSKVDDVRQLLHDHPSVGAYKRIYQDAWKGFDDQLSRRLIDEIMEVHPIADEESFVEDVFQRLVGIPLVDPYLAYQCLDDQWREIVNDLETIQGEGLSALKKVDPHMVVKKKEDKEEEVVDKKEPWIGRILPFNLVQNELLHAGLDEIASLVEESSRCTVEIDGLFETLAEDEQESDFVKEEGEGFDFAELEKAIEELYGNENDELAVLAKYKALGTKRDSKDTRIAFVKDHPEVNWAAMRASGGCYTAKVVNARMDELRSAIELPEDSLIVRLQRADSLNNRRKKLDKEVKERRKELHEVTKNTIEGLTEEQALCLLRKKWIGTFLDKLMKIPNEILEAFTTEITGLIGKYATDYESLGTEIRSTESNLIHLLSDLQGSDDDVTGIGDFISFLGGE